MSKDYNQDALNDAVDMAFYFAAEIADSLIEREDVYSLEIDGLDDYHHENHVDKDYSLLEAATILEQVENETDYGLWEGLERDARRAISAQAAYSYGNAVLWRFDEIIAGLQSDDRVRKILDSESDDDLTLPLVQVLREILPEFRPTNQEESAVETRKAPRGWQWRVRELTGWNGSFLSKENAIAAAQAWMRG